MVKWEWMDEVLEVVRHNIVAGLIIWREWEYSDKEDI